MVDSHSPLDALREAISVAGSQGKLARMCGVSSTAVWKWLQVAKRIPAEFVLSAEAGTGVSRHRLRPDIYPVEPMGSGFRRAGQSLSGAAK